MIPIPDMVLRISAYAPAAVLRTNYRLVDDYDGPGSNPRIVDWNAAAIGLPEPTQAQLAAIVLPSLGTRFEAEVDAFNARRDPTSLLLNALFRLHCEAHGLTLPQGLAAMKAKIHDILD